MPAADPRFLLPALLAVGVLAQWVASRLRVPAIVLLLGLGLFLGPVTGWLDPELLLGDLLRPAVALAVAIVLFEGGLSLRLSEARQLGPPLWALVIVGLLVTVVSCTLAGHFLAGLSWGTSVVLGSVLVVTGPTVIKPMLRGARLERRPALLLKWESIVNDPLGALLAVLSLEVAAALSTDKAGHPWGWIALAILIAALLGGAAAWLLARAMDRRLLPEHLKVPAILAGVLGIFALGESLYHEAGLLAVTVMGVVLANLASPSIESIRHFKEDVTTVLVAMLFLVLSAGLDLDSLGALDWRAGVFVLVVLFVVRPLTSLLSLGWSSVPRREVAFIGWVAPRGVVAAAMGGALEPRLEEYGYPDAGLLVPILFLVILSTVILHGLSIGPLARRLGVAAKDGGGLLFVGAEPWARALAKAVQAAGAEVVVVDDDFRHVMRARMEGLTAVYGDVLSEETMDELPTEQIAWLLAATDDEPYNALACVALSKTLGREHVIQLTEEQSKHSAENHLQGLRPWGPEGRHASLDGSFELGAEFKSLTLSESYDWETFCSEQPGAVPLFFIGANGLRPAGPSDLGKPGDRVVFQSLSRPA